MIVFPSWLIEGFYAIFSGQMNDPNEWGPMIWRTDTIHGIGTFVVVIDKDEN